MQNDDLANRHGETFLNGNSCFFPLHFSLFSFCFIQGVRGSGLLGPRGFAAKRDLQKSFPPGFHL